MNTFKILQRIKREGEISGTGLMWFVSVKSLNFFLKFFQFLG